MSSGRAKRWIIGNLDAEREMAILGGARPPPTSTAALRTASALATLLRVFGQDGDRLWTPVAVDPERVPPVTGVSRPVLTTGRIPDVEVVFAWASTPSTPGGADPEVAARVNRRDFLVRETGRYPDRLFPGRCVHSRAEVERHLPDGPFVLKAPWSAAGRLRVLGRGPLESAARRRIDDLIDRFGSLVLEPWLPRDEDFGCSGHVREDGVRLLPPHRLLTDRRGRFRGIDSRLAPALADRAADAARRAGERLAAAGYRGPFGVDGLAGPAGIHVPVEINARATFGHVAAELAGRLGRAVSLRLGPGLSPVGVSLLRAGDDDPTEARVEF